MTIINNTPKYFFHGTSALSVWSSYFEGKIVSDLNKNTLPIHLTARNIERGFNVPPEHKPIYPSIFGTGKTSITVDLFTAWRFAFRWKCTPFEHNEDFKLELHSSINRGLRLYSISTSPSFLLGLSLSPIKSLIRSEISSYDVGRFMKILNDKKSPSYTTGAILVLNRSLLEYYALLSAPEGEESALAKYIPWKSIYGVLFTEQANYEGTFRNSVFRYWPVNSDNNSIIELKAYLENQKVSCNTLKMKSPNIDKILKMRLV